MQKVLLIFKAPVHNQDFSRDIAEDEDAVADDLPRPIGFMGSSINCYRMTVEIESRCNTMKLHHEEA